MTLHYLAAFKLLRILVVLKRHLQRYLGDDAFYSVDEFLGTNNDYYVIKTRFQNKTTVENVHYIERDGNENYYVMGSTPPTLDKKMKLLTYFRRYMTEHLMKAGGSIQILESDSFSRIPHLHLWHRSTTAVIMQLTNGTVQINFMDHSKIIMCPLMQAVTYIDILKNFRTFRFTTLSSIGYPNGLIESLSYAHRKIGSMLTKPQ